MARLGRILVALAALAGVAFLLAGCGHKEASTPVACFEGEKAFLKALEAAPGEVELGEGATLGDCLPENQDPGDLAQVGEALIGAATALNAEGREGDAEAATELGYLVGSVERRATETDGVHANLVRRLLVAARFAPGKQPLTGRFREAYETGFAAAGESGD